MTYFFGRINMSESSKNTHVLICILQGLSYLKGANLRVTSHDCVFLLNDKKHKQTLQFEVASLKVYKKAVFNFASKLELENKLCCFSNYRNTHLNFFF